MPEFPKTERLCSQKIIDSLFAKGDKFISFPFSIRFMLCESEKDGADVLFSVPKRFIKKAVARNRIKRLLREAYRLQKDDFIKSLNLVNQRLHISITLIAQEEFTFEQMQGIIKDIFSKLYVRLQPK
ncbi:MAG: ribonuclease P protein component [Bacteroidales bacterium]|jgi:ribonuclease P protein component|nr:ribonuclease P protein component [Bacteroidales bacterium]